MKEKRLSNFLDQRIKQSIQVTKSIKKEKIRIISLTSKITSILDIGVATMKSNDTARIREAHKFIGYIVCELIEKKYL